MNDAKPFPTIEKLAQECGANWPYFMIAAKATRDAEQKLQNALLGMTNG